MPLREARGNLSQDGRHVLGFHRQKNDISFGDNLRIIVQCLCANRGAELPASPSDGSLPRICSEARNPVCTRPCAMAVAIRPQPMKPTRSDAPDMERRSLSKMDDVYPIDNLYSRRAFADQSFS